MIVYQTLCTGCGVCVEECFLHALCLRDGKAEFWKKRRCISCGHCAARCPTGAITLEEGTSEIEQYDKERCTVVPERLLSLMKFRRSTRAFQPHPVAEEAVRHMVEAGRYAGTGGNRQPLRYLVLAECLPEVLQLSAEALERLARACDSQGQLDFYSGTYHMIYRERLAGRDALFYGAHQVILVVGDRGRGVSTEADGYLAAAYLQLMGQTLGIGSCINCFFLDAVGESEALRKLLGLRPGEMVVSAMAVGYPAVEYRRSVVRHPADITWQ